MRKSLFVFIIINLFTGCAKVKFQDRLYDDFEDFTKTVQELPENLQVSLGKNIAQLENAGFGLIDKGKSAGNELIDNAGNKFEETFSNSIKTAKSEMTDVLKQTNDIAKERINQVDEVADNRIRQVDTMREKSLNKTDTIIRNAISRVDTMLQNTISNMDIAVGNKTVLINDFAKQDVKAFMKHLDSFAVKQTYLINKLLEQRINQIFKRLNGSIQLASNQLNEVLGRNIHRFYYMGNIVAKNLLDAAQKSTTILILVLIKGVILIIIIIYLFSIIISVVKSRLKFNLSSIGGMVFFLTIGCLLLFSDSTEKIVGEKYIKTDDVFVSAEKKFKSVEAVFNSSDTLHTWNTINLCTETIMSLEMCKVLSPPDNQTLQAYYDDRIDDVNWLLSKSLPEKFLKRK